MVRMLIDTSVWLAHDNHKREINEVDFDGGYNFTVIDGNSRYGILTGRMGFTSWFLLPLNWNIYALKGRLDYELPSRGILHYLNKGGPVSLNFETTLPLNEDGMYYKVSISKNIPLGMVSGNRVFLTPSLTFAFPDGYFVR